VTRRRWIADEVSGNRAALVGEHAQHLSRVLRARVGQQFDIVVSGVVRHARISAIYSDRVEFELADEVVSSDLRPLTLALAIFKFDRMEWAIEKCTELGVSRIFPVIANRSDKHLAKAAIKRRERWQRIAREASEQSRRSAPPEISLPLSLAEAVALPSSPRILLAEAEEQVFLRDVLGSHSGSENIILAIGPEGGWTNDELKLFRDAGWVSASLGPTILRAETAAIAAVAIVVSQVDSLS
jgi:16S rRNA (uracil1498-N3)-methyltransferase